MRIKLFARTIITLLLFTSSPVGAQNFQKYLQNTTVYDITMDEDNILWIGTENGLYRYDSKAFRHYSFDPTDSTSISNNSVRSLYIDSHQRLWVGTRSGLNLYNASQDVFIRQFSDDQKNNPLKGIFVKTIGEDAQGLVWFATDTNEFWEVNTGKNTFKSKKTSIDAPIFSDRNTGKKILNIDSMVQIIVPKQTITSTFVDKNSNYYLGTIKGMIFKVPAGAKNLTEMIAMNDELNDLGAIRVIYKDERNNLWIGSEKGLFVKYQNKKQFSFFHFNEFDESYLSVRSFFKDENNYLWIAGGNKMLVLDANTLQNKKDNYPALYNINGVVYKLYQDSRKNIWIGTFGNGVYQFDPVSGNLEHFFLHEHIPDAGEDINKIWDITEDENGDIWIASWGGGLVFHNRSEKTFSTFKNQPNNPYSISSNKILSLLQDSEGVLWVGTDGGGLNAFDNETGIFSRYNITNQNNLHIQDRSILCLYEDSKGIVWAGSDGGGLFRYDRLEKRFVIYSNTQGLKNQSVKMILEDNNHNLWVSTNGGGIFKLDKSQGSFYQFTAEDGISSNRFQNGSGFIDSSGILYFGSAQGVTFFDPDSVKTSEYEPSLFIKELLLNNKRKDINGILYSEHLKNDGRIRLKPKHKILQMRFASVDYSTTERNYYRYRIKGLNDHWVNIDGKPEITVMNLPSGKYMLEIQFTNNDGAWMDNTRRFSLYVLPPFYKTPLFMGFVFSLIGIILYLLHSYNVKSIKKRREELEQEVFTRTEKIFEQGEKLKKQNQILRIQKNELTLRNQKIIKSSERIRLMTKKLHESDVMKIKFFTNISHEIRTPLTLIIAPLDQLIADFPDKKGMENSQYLSSLYTMRNNASRILKLFDQIITFRKLESGSLKIRKQNVNLSELLKNVINCFEDYAGIMSINLKLSDHTKGLSMSLDPEKMEMVFNNLLSNALKFTDKNGLIELEINEMPVADNPESTAHDKATSMAAISVKDTGTGIGKDSKQKIFETFYQEDNKATKNSDTGFGLGLSITKSIVDMHGGKIEVESETGKGSIFRIILPLTKNDQDSKNKHLTAKTRHPYHPAISYSEYNSQISDALPRLAAPTDKKAIIERKKVGNRKTILVVEDNFELRNYLVNYLSKKFNIFEAENGLEGIKVAQEHHPDIIVSDVIMPHTDGFAVLEKLKNNAETSHIPVIMLTAKADVEDKIKGMKLLADAYLTKPFHIKHLNAVIESITENRLKLQKKYRSIFDLNNSQIQIVSPDDKFISKTKQIIEKNISNADFNVQHLSAEVGVSRAGLYRKVKSLMNISVNSLIKYIRIKRAAQILTQSNLYISEVAFEVGFNDVSYFRKCFREIYQMTPSEYVVKHKDEPMPKNKENIDLFIE